jgi:hypothetical protein
LTYNINNKSFHEVQHNLDYLKPDWCDLKWTEWIKFSDKGRIKEFPSKSGFYRIKASNQDELFYIGQTGRTLRERVRMLITNSLKEDMPYNDPHTAAPSLWAWIDSNSLMFEASCAPISLSKQEREVMECFLLWRYRSEKGESTKCNHGRFHPGYKKSKDRSTGYRGGKLPPGQMNPAGDTSLEPLLPMSEHGKTDWMGLDWISPKILAPANLRFAPESKGLYTISGSDLYYIGQTTSLKNRLLDHSRKKWIEHPVSYQYCILPPTTLPHQLKELENDLIGAYYYQTKRAPRFQFVKIQ